MSPQDRLTVVVSEEPIIYDSDITTLTPANLQLIENIIQIATEATQLKKAKENEKAAQKSAEERQMENILLAMLESPSGITKADILVASESDQFVPAINKFRAFLRRNNMYTLKKRTKTKQTLYILDPVR